MKAYLPFLVLGMSAQVALANSPQAHNAPAAKHSIEVSQAIKAAVEHPVRSAENKQRDKYRHPAETLAFFGIEPDMTVVELWPGGGWYTEILGPLLSEKGKLYAAHFDPEQSSDYFQKSLKSFKQKINDNRDVYKSVVITAFNPPEKLNIAPAGSADAVLTFRNLHNWMRNGPEQTKASFQAMYDALKPGGILGLVEHKQRSAAEQDVNARNGYVREDYAIQLAESVGFELVASSDINANPADKGVYEMGVWTLPPRLRLGDQDKEKYLKIGESNRMTLKFKKPDVE